MARVTRVNEWIALHITVLFGSMWATYLFFFYGFLPLFFPNQEVNLLYWSNTVQLWSLPLLMVGTNLLNRSSEQQAQRQYAMIQRIDHITQTITDSMGAQRAMLSTLIDVAETSTAVLKTVEAKTQEIDAEVDILTAKGGRAP